MTRKGFPSDTNGKDCACQYSRCKSHGFNSWVWKIPGEGNGNPLQYFCLGNPMDRGLVGYSPWGYKRVRHDSAIEQQKEHWKRVRLPMALSVTNPQQFVDHRK